MKPLTLKKVIWLILIPVSIFYLYLFIVAADFNFEKAEAAPKIDSSGVRLKIETEYREYLLNQTVYVMIRLINKSDKQYEMDREISIATVNFRIIRPDNKNVSSMFGCIDYLNMEPHKFIMPGDTMKMILDLNSYFRNAVNMLNPLAGDYTIRATYKGIESNLLRVQINNPTGGDKEIFDNTFGAHYLFTNNDQSMKLTRLLNEHTESPYFPQLFKQLLMFTPEENKSDTERFLKLFKIYFDNFSNSYSQTRMIELYSLHLVNYAKYDSVQNAESLERLRQKYRGTLIEKNVDEWFDVYGGKLNHKTE